jgi:hypothetical protein
MELVQINGIGPQRPQRGLELFLYLLGRPPVNPLEGPRKFVPKLGGNDPPIALVFYRLADERLG